MAERATPPWPPAAGPVAASVPGAVLGVGTDLVDVERIGAAVARTPGLLTRVFTDAERTWAGASRHPEQRLAARFAAKEAVLKALGAGLGSAPLTDIEVVRGTSGAPSVALHGRAAELARALGVDRVLVSLTHTSTTAAAFAVAMGGPGADPGPGAGAGVRVRRAGSLDGDHA